VVKRGFDIVVSLVALVLLAPLFLAIALAIKLADPGPVFYRHRRITFGGQQLEILKFRTMHARHSTGKKFGGRTDADVFAELGCPELNHEFGEHQKLRDDPRVSRIGAWLRRTSLDELPQFWNVLKGDLSTVGPRPIVQTELNWYGDASALLLLAKPGLTGLWQVSGRSELSYEDRVDLDLQYVNNWSVLLDLKIVVRTLPAVLSGRGAY
jgi:exopolysaccharide production protein ExoY